MLPAGFVSSVGRMVWDIHWLPSSRALLPQGAEVPDSGETLTGEVVTYFASL
jgi:hypothetical protein